ncbi:thioesterase [Salibacterium salarium]|uniref:Thioesterase n=1 Tax=Salibacterium salarium TaxID=284579 RepID=A0A3R9RDK9_9BACI|nr:thioesterase family protein [Salibacterium salarium]RSL33082.1 thioesterase [Salibacterium salarium]
MAAFKWKETVQKEWVDYNGHMNDAAYATVFSLAVEKLMESLGLNESKRKALSYTIFTLETHICYLQEAKEGEELQVTFQLLDHDAKRLHAFFIMTNKQGDKLATSEQMLMGIDTQSEKPAPFPKEIEESVQHTAAKHRTWSIPETVGRTIGIKKK